MALPVFKDIHPAHDGGGYSCTNEEPHIHTALIDRYHPKGKTFQRAAAISSGGEIPILVLLSRAEEVIAIDHSYMALGHAYLKCIMLDLFGPKAFLDMITTGDHATATKMFTEAKPLVPTCMHPRLYSFDVSSNKKFWNISLETLTLIHSRLDKLTFVHGDLTDLSHFGVFDVLYISNALEHQGRSRKGPKMDDFRTFVKDDGLVLMTTAKGAKNLEWAGPFPGWETLNTKEENMIGPQWVGQLWDYRILAKRPVCDAPPADLATGV